MFAVAPIDSAAQLLSREPRVFFSRPNVRGTLVAVEKAASHSVSFVTIIVWGARSRFKRIWLSWRTPSCLSFDFALSCILIYAQVWSAEVAKAANKLIHNFR